ncbi:hypothetical protein [Neorickettsia findlayensis]|uniref:Macro domain-containing protein n=1 Tax=Neorickettsia findlayensis TaxID=2686014 RepID=A0A6P1G8Z2_9RICK|nr:hypothetical protein [Neorickettsia findlayensis]QHD64939.1 hypothetical protein GP480_00415 [Neorickettsia findlayensis]
MDKNQWIALGVALGLLVLLLLAAMFYCLHLLFRRRASLTADKEEEGEQLLPEGSPVPHPKDQVPVKPAALPPFHLASPELGPQKIQIYGQRNCYLSQEGILGVKPGEQGHKWRGNVIVLDPSGTIFQTRCYSGGGASGALYAALGVYGEAVGQVVSSALARSRVVVNPSIFIGRHYRVHVVHLQSPDMRRRDGGEASVRVLKMQLLLLFLEAFSVIRRESFPGDSIIMMPLVASGIHSGGIGTQDYCRAFCDAFCTAAAELGGGDLVAALGVQELRICCYGTDTQRALAEVMAQRAITGRGALD